VTGRSRRIAAGFGLKVPDLDGTMQDLSSVNDPDPTRNAMKTKTKHRKSYKWKKKADSSPIAKGRRVKRHGIRNAKKRRAHLGGAGL
jgi:hypothetical protein